MAIKPHSELRAERASAEALELLRGEIAATCDAPPSGGPCYQCGKASIMHGFKMLLAAASQAVEGGVMKDERDADGAGLAVGANDTTVVPASTAPHDATWTPKDAIDSVVDKAKRLRLKARFEREWAERPKVRNRDQYRGNAARLDKQAEMHEYIGWLLQKAYTPGTVVGHVESLNSAKLELDR